MIPAKRPVRDHVEDFDSAILKQPNQAFKELLKQNRSAVLRRYKVYEKAGGVPYRTKALSLPEEARLALRSNFTLLDLGRSLAHIREEILKLAFVGKCAMCGLGPAKSIDHFLPKEDYPEFSIFALNMVPCCGQCNNAKRRFISDKDGRLFHSYFDNVSHVECWLKCEFAVVGGGLVSIFEVNPALPSPFKENALRQFERLKLSDAYELAASSDILEHLDGFVEAYAEGGVGGVKDEAAILERRVRRFGEHYWKTALYRGMQASDIFCNEGFERIRY